MIYLTKGQPLFGNPSMVVCDQTGYYDDGSSVICAAAYDPESPICRYEAKFIAYGGSVYTITDPEKLMEEVLKIDPKSLFGKSNQDTVADKIVENIQMVDSTKTPTPTTPSNPEPVFTDPQQVDAALSTSTPTVVENPVIVPKPIPELLEPTFNEATTTLETIIEKLPSAIEVVQSSLSTTTPLSEITF